jgi:hypothetical protein
MPTQMNIDDRLQDGMRLSAGISEHQPTTAKLTNLPYKEGVAGSIGHRPLRKYLQIAAFTDKRERVERRFPALLLQPY